MTASTTSTARGIEAYPQAIPMDSRFGDLDADGLLSETALARFIEQARVHMLEATFRACGMDPRRGEYGMLIAHVAITPRCHRPPSTELQVGVGVTLIGRSSLRLKVGVFGDGLCMAEAENVMVITTREDGRPAEIPPALRERLRLQVLAPATGPAMA